MFKFFKSKSALLAFHGHSYDTQHNCSVVSGASSTTLVDAIEECTWNVPSMQV